MDERFLAHKTLFPLALASAKRVGELHALSFLVSHSKGWSEASFRFVPGFVAKTQDASSHDLLFEGFCVPALPKSSANPNSRLLCPVRAVRCYLARTAPHRPRCERLLVTAGRLKKEIFKNTVSVWLRKVISQVYRLLGRPLPVPLSRLGKPVVLLRLFFLRRTLLPTRYWRRVRGGIIPPLRATTWGTCRTSPSTPSTWVLWWQLRLWFDQASCPDILTFDSWLTDDYPVYPSPAFHRCTVARPLFWVSIPTLIFPCHPCVDTGILHLNP